MLVESDTAKESFDMPTEIHMKATMLMINGMATVSLDTPTYDNEYSRISVFNTINSHKRSLMGHEILGCCYPK